MLYASIRIDKIMIIALIDDVQLFTSIEIHISIIYIITGCLELAVDMKYLTVL